MKIITTFLITFLAFSAAIAQSTVTGYVFQDDNENGGKDRREKGVEGVSVSNGKEVTMTDKNGKYELPVGDDNAIFVIKPASYRYTINENNLPQFYYLHKPSGSPDLKFKGVDPTGKLPKVVNFALIPEKEDDEFTALIFGDPQVRNEAEVGYFSRGIVAEAKNINNVAFGISLGDLAFNDLDILPSYIGAVKQIGIPWYNVMGNHDMNFDVKEDVLADETFEKHFGPANYAFNYGQVHFIILDDILYPDPLGEKKYRGGLREDQLEFIENDLKFVPKNKLIVLAFHIPLATIRDKDRRNLFNLLKNYPHTLSLSAHTHRQMQNYFSKDDGWPGTKPHHEYNVGTTSGSWYSGELDHNGIPYATMKDGTPKGYAFIRFEDNQYVIDYKAYDQPADNRIGITAPKVVAQNERTFASIYANIYMGQHGDTVMYRIDDGEWKPMKYTIEDDPAFLHLLYKWDVSETLLKGSRPGNPIESTHLWKAPIPSKLDEGEHTIEVKAVDMFGRTFSQTRKYRIENPASGK